MMQCAYCVDAAEGWLVSNLRCTQSLACSTKTQLAVCISRVAVDARRDSGCSAASKQDVAAKKGVGMGAGLLHNKSGHLFSLTSHYLKPKNRT
jgi:hypothetical protein